MAVTTTAKTTPITPSSEHSYDGDGWDELQQLEKILKKKSSAASNRQEKGRGGREERVC